MSLSQKYRQLAALIEALESNGITVREADPADGNGGQSDENAGFSVRMALELPPDWTADGLGTELTAAAPTTADRRGTDRTTRSVDAGSEATAAGSDGAGDAADPVQTPEPSAGTGSAATAAGDRTAAENADGSAPPSAEATAAADANTNTDADAVAVPKGDADSDANADAVADADATTAEGGNDPADPAGDGTVADTGDDGGEVSCTHPDCDRTFGSARGMKIHRTKAHSLSELVSVDDGRGVHHDPEVLERVYEDHDTFAEMTEALDVDVGAQAVRKQMIRHGIHEPGAGRDDATDATDDAASTPAPDGEPVAADGGDRTDDVGGAAPSSDPPSVDREAEPTTDRDGGTTTDEGTGGVRESLPDLDLPGSVTAGDLQDAVESANTLYDVQRTLDLDPERTRDLLAEYDLLELVSGRAAAVRDREEMKTEIDQRLRRTAT
jgi:hypothetical protein